MSDGKKETDCKSGFDGEFTQAIKKFDADADAVELISNPISSENTAPKKANTPTHKRRNRKTLDDAISAMRPKI